MHASAAWCDLGCGTGLGAAAGLGTVYAGTALLVDVDKAAVEQARTTIEAHAIVMLRSFGVPKRKRAKTAKKTAKKSAKR